MVVILVLISAVPLLISIGVNFYSTVTRATEEVEADSAQRTKLINANITGLFEKNLNGIRAMAVNEATVAYLQNPSAGADAMDNSLARTNEIFGDSNPTHVTDANGQQLLRSDHKPPVNTATRACIERSAEAIKETNRGSRRITEAVHAIETVASSLAEETQTVSAAMEEQTASVHEVRFREQEAGRNGRRAARFCGTLQTAQLIVYFAAKEDGSRENRPLFVSMEKTKPAGSVKAVRLNGRFVNQS